MPFPQRRLNFSMDKGTVIIVLYCHRNPLGCPFLLLWRSLAFALKPAFSVAAVSVSFARPATSLPGHLFWAFSEVGPACLQCSAPLLFWVFLGLSGSFGLDRASGQFLEGFVLRCLLWSGMYLCNNTVPV